VKIVNLEDFEKLGHILQDLREERIQLQKQVTILEDIKHDNETRINELELQLQKQETITGKIKNISKIKGGGISCEKPSEILNIHMKNVIFYREDKRNN